MPINPVTTSTASAALQIQQPKPDTQNQAAQASDRARAEQAGRSRQAEQVRERPVEKAPEPKAPESPKPVVNTQGQTTGKVINVTA